jgi:CRP-like cAMP-binding protein
MTVEALVTPLLRVPLFQDLQPLHPAKIARRAERIVYKPGELIIREGGVGDAAYLVVAGETARIQGPGDLGEEDAVSANSLIGEMAMLIETEHTSTVIAKSQVRALRIPRDAMHELMEQDPGLAEHFIDKLTGRLQHLAEELRRIDQSLEGASETIPASRALVRPDRYAPAVQ